MFIMQGEETKLVRHIISYAEDENEMQEMCVSDEHKSEVERLLSSRGIEFVSETVDQTENEWFNGLCFKSYDKAREVFEAGEQAYLADKRRQEAIDNLQLRADILPGSDNAANKLYAEAWGKVLRADTYRRWRANLVHRGPHGGVPAAI